MLRFHSDLYRRDAVDAVLRQYESRAQITRSDQDRTFGLDVVPRDPLEDVSALRGSIANAMLRETAQRLREPTAVERDRPSLDAASDSPAWWLVLHEPGSPLGNGWVLDSVSSIRSGTCTMRLRHESLGTASVAIYRNAGGPVGVAHTDELDFMLLNGGAGSSVTDTGIGQVLLAMAARIRRAPAMPARLPLVALLGPHAERSTRGADVTPESTTTSTPATRFEGVVDIGASSIRVEVEEATVGRLPLFDALVTLTRDASVLLSRVSDARIGIELRPFDVRDSGAMNALAESASMALDVAVRKTGTTARGPSRAVDLDALVAELARENPLTYGLGFEPERGPGHEAQRVLNLRGTGACNSDCVFCVEKFNMTHRLMQGADATREQIVSSAGEYDMLLFASGEPTIHPKLFDYASVARSVGFKSLGMSSHFRTFADPAFARRTLEAGFQFFDISLHAADLASQLEVNPIDDGGHSLTEALFGLAVLHRLADAMGIRISVTHKIVASKMNVQSLKEIVKATYDRGVRHFIIQPVRANGLVEIRQSKLAIAESEILPHLNELLDWAATLPGAVVKPYGFSRQSLPTGAHVESEQNRVKNVYGRERHEGVVPMLPETTEEKATDGRHWVVVTNVLEQRFAFASDGSSPVLDSALERGADLMFGCRMGSCGMCAAHLIEGTVDQSTQAFLTPEQVDAGYVLLCQAKPCSDVVVRLCREHEIDPL